MSEDKERNIYQAKITKNTILQKLENIHNWADVENIIISTFTDLQLAETVFKEIDRYREQGISINQNEEVRKFIKNIRRLAKLQLMQKIAEFDSLTQLAFSSLEDVQQNEIEFKYISDQLILEEIYQYKEGQFYVITGGLGSGKTHTAVILTEFLIKKNFYILTNIPILTKDEHIIHVEKFSQFIEELAQLRKKNLNSVFILDEGSINYKKQDATTSKNKMLDSFLMMLRKLNTNLIYIVQNEINIPTIFYSSDFITTKLYKPSKKKLIIFKLNKGKTYNITDVPGKTLPFLTKSRSFFLIDLNKYTQVEKLLRKYNI